MPNPSHLIPRSLTGAAIGLVTLAFVGPAAAQDSPLDQLPQDVIDALPAETIEGLRDGSIDQIPDAVVDRLPDTLADRIPSDLLEGASGTFIAVLIVVGLVALAGFMYGVVKSAMKAALFFAIIAAIAGFLLYNNA